MAELASEANPPAASAAAAAAAAVIRSSRGTNALALARAFEQKASARSRAEGGVHVKKPCEDVDVKISDSNMRYQNVEAGYKADSKRAGEVTKDLLAQSTEALAVERQSRLQAEAREEDERRERISTTANAQAMTTAHRQEMEEQKIVRAKQEAEWELRIENMVKEKDRLKEAIIVAEERELELEAKVQSLTDSREEVKNLNKARLESFVEVLSELRLKMKAMEEELVRAKSSTLQLRAMTDEKERRTNDAETQLASISEKLACAESRANESLTQKEQEWEARLVDATSKALQEVTLQKAKLDEKEMEVEALTEEKSEMLQQRAAEQREQDLRDDDRRAMEERIARLEEEKATLVGAMSSRDSSIASLAAEISLLKEQSTEALAVERQSRLRVEAREEDERRERISTMANAQAMTTAHRQEMEEQKIVRAKQEAEWELRIENMVKEKDRLKEAIIVAEERELELEAKVQNLTDSLEELNRAKVAMHHRLEAKVMAGEAQRRLMHNLIQELRGNVRVFARVRPFLPSDNVSDDAKPAVVSKGDGTGCILSKHVVGDGKDYGADTHFFAFDKSFAPSAGQGEVFTEVSEFVQSALDGYNVCLFSFGQTGSGKTHTMQGSGAGTMRGIIPRAMEQVGKSKSELEAQGWEYDMTVSFLEIYNEQIKDLLRPDSCSKDVKHEIKHDNHGNTSVSDLTTEAVDPNDGTMVEGIMQRAASRRSVGRTDMNDESSRGHSVLTLHMKAINRSQRSTLKGTLHLVDLAGSERLGRSHAQGDRRKETLAINKSLSALTDVFVAISNKSSHIPFRNSKLTYLLQPALSGDGKSLMMVTLSPTEESYHESLCSLRFASQVNGCELGKPKRQISDTGSTVKPSARGSRVKSSRR